MCTGHYVFIGCNFRGVREDLIRSLPFCKSACDEVQANSSDAGDIELCMDELRRIFTEDRPLRKVSSDICPLRKISVEKRIVVGT